ncbi:MAG TPA: NAD(P)H-binding protein [Mycobacteriales bacterium]|nr:NAD(P)H-binding protein [Mycobacteriales bacterium]
MRIAVAGATGFVGSALVRALARTEHEVRALSRDPSRFVGPADEVVAADVSDASSLPAALRDVDVLVYLVHSLAHHDFTSRDREAARNVAHAAADAGVQQIVYLGGLGDEDDALSEHLTSRREVESVLGSAGVPVTVLRAGIVIGHGGTSWEILRQLVRRLPVMVTPRWVTTRSQPISLEDVVAYLVGVIGNDTAKGRTFDVGGPEVLRYADMLERTARIMGRPLLILPVPVLSPGLSSWWLKLITDVDLTTAQALVKSMTNEVVVRDPAIRTVVPRQLMTFAESVERALADRAADRG